MYKLYVADIQLVLSPEVFEDLLSKVKEQRRAKVLRCKNEEDKQRSLLAGVLLRYGLEQQGLIYEQLEFAMTPERKPILKSHPNIHFSISHAGAYVVCLMAEEEVGVDIEWKNRPLLAQGVAQRLRAVAQKSFSTQEYEAFVQTPTERQIDMFLKLWTRKEAASKAVGKGLAMDFSKIGEAEEQYLSFALTEEYYASVYRKNGPISREQLEVEYVKQLPL